MSAIRILWVGFAAILLAGSLHAQVVYPKPPGSYTAEIAYRIDGGREVRSSKFREMLRNFQALKFDRVVTEDNEDDDIDPSAQSMAGTIPSANGRALLSDPRVQSVLLYPADWKFPADPKSRVRVLFDLSTGRTGGQQKAFRDQVLVRLAQLGFADNVAYDSRNYSIVRGTLPSGLVRTMLRDLRTLPDGWFLSETPLEFNPQPFSTARAIRVVEVLGPVSVERNGRLTTVPIAAAPKDFPSAEKLTGEVLDALAAAPEKPLRVEVQFDRAVLSSDLRTLTSFLDLETRLDGTYGDIGAFSLSRASLLAKIAARPDVVTIRLPTAATPSRLPATERPPAPKEVPKKEPEEPKKDASIPTPSILLASMQVAPKDILDVTGLRPLHERGFIGTGVRAIVIDTDFGGAEKEVGKGLGAKTRILDLTSLRNAGLDPEPSAGGTGHGTLVALAMQKTAPGAELLLVRIEATTPFRLTEILRAVRGDKMPIAGILNRREDVTGEATLLASERAVVAKAYRNAFDNIGDEEESRPARTKATEDFKGLQAKEVALTRKFDRLDRISGMMLGIKGTDIVVCPLTWNFRFAADSSSGLTQEIDELLARPRSPVVRNGSKIVPPPLWIQAAGDTRGQAWSGRFSDPDRSGNMQFLPSELPLPAGRWGRDLMFLGFSPFGSASVADLPAAGKVRVSMQWREPTEPGLPETDYREPISSLELQILRQLDPSGETLPSDEMEPAARSVARPVRLAKEANYAVWEQSFEVTIAAAGRYALRLEGKKPGNIRPYGSASVPQQDTEWDLRPRILLEVLDESTAAKGRAVFLDAPQGIGFVSVPADARNALAVGSLDASNRPMADSAVGAGSVTELRLKPDILAPYDASLPVGTVHRPTAVSTGVAAGIAASMVSAGASKTQFLGSVGVRPGTVLQVSPEWLARRFPAR